MSGIRKSFFIFFMFVQACSVFSQIAPGEWRTHFSYSSANQVVYADDKVYVEASNKLYSYSSTGIMETFSTLTGLNGHNITHIAWCKTEKTLIIVYSDGNIDFLTQSGFVNLSDFKDKSLNTSKTINGIRVEGSKAYLCTNAGLLILDVAKREISDTYYLHFASSYTKVYDMTVWADTLIVATESGLYWGKTSSNLQDAAYWSEMPFISGATVKKIVRFNNTFFALADNDLVYKNSGNAWSVFLGSGNISNVLVQDGYMFICSENQAYMYNSNMELQNIQALQNYGIALDPIHDLLYLASGTKGLNILSKTNGQYNVSVDSIMGNGPVSNCAFSGLFRDGVFYSTAGGRFSNRYFYPGNILIFKDEKWTDLPNKEEIVSKTGLPLMDFINMAIDPNDSEHFFITSYGEGLYEFRKNAFAKLWDESNSTLLSAVADNNPSKNRYVRIEGATFDKKGNLWVLNSFVNHPSQSPLHILKTDGTWFSPHYSKMPNSSGWNSILFTSKNQVWINSFRNNYGIFILDYGDDIENTSDDKTRWISTFTDQDANFLSPYNIFCVTEDLNGIIWIGTNNGPILASNVSNIFNSDFTFSRVKIPRNDGSGNADFLLNDIRVTCITVDGGNRKWIGTTGFGVYLLSSDGLTTIHHFDTKNSPLPSDNIMSITVNPETGEVFIGTEAGLVSYRSDATQGADSYGNVHVFPNPVKPEHTGNITVTGLMENTQVKITDLAGNLMISGTSLGGQFSWNGLTAKGKKAASGVYLVFCASEDGSEYQACKFMIVH